MEIKIIDKKTEYPGIDLFRVIAVILVVMNHTYPLAGINETADFVLARIIARVAVPFFFMVSGYFILPSIIGENKDYTTVIRNVKKLVKLYIIATLIYLPIGIYSGNIGVNIGVVGALKELLFNGTFYHLWYLPGAIIGILIVSMLLKRFNQKQVFMISLGLYIVGLFGDSYYKIAESIPVIKELYNLIFNFFDYTRNGIFFSPLFFILGAIIANDKRKPKKKIMMYGFIITLSLMIVEGLILNKFQIQRHSSMYILLLPVMYFLFQWILLWKNRSFKILRNISMIVYIIHPLVIILIRGFAKVLKLQDILVSNNLIHFVAVLFGSFVLAFIIDYILGKITKKRSVNSSIRRHI
ncbi:MAG: acyltransferase [Clostridium sp.]|nr:acyltransferase [Clostridium sp.]